MKTLALIATLAATMAAGQAAAQTQLVSNGSFENGTTSWVVAGNCPASAITSGNSVGAFTPSPVGPTAGAKYVQLYPVAPNETCFLYQDIAIPAGQTTLSVDASAGFNPNAMTAGYIGAFRVMTTANVVLATPFVRNGSQAAAPDLAGFTADLTPYAGQTVRLAFELMNGPSCCNVTYGDNVSVLTAPAAAAVPTMTEWAMILLGVLLAGGAALTLHRRRTA